MWRSRQAGKASSCCRNQPDYPVGGKRLRHGLIERFGRDRPGRQHLTVIYDGYSRRTLPVGVELVEEAVVVSAPLADAVSAFIDSGGREEDSTRILDDVTVESFAHRLVNRCVL